MPAKAIETRGVMNCLNCIQRFEREQTKNVCALHNAEIPASFLETGCDEWGSLEIIHNRDAAVIVCRMCETACVREPRGVLPVHRMGSYRCPGSLTNNYVDSVNKMRKEKRSAD